MRAYDIIKQKRDGEKVSEAQVRFLIDSFVREALPDYQMAAFLMSVFFRGMDDEETFWLTDAMRTSGDLVGLEGIRGFTVDKHSTGGVGDKTSLVLGPVLASLGLKVAKMSGRGLGHTGGTIDKLEAISGFSCHLSAEQFIEVVNRIGVAIIGQTGNLVPADKKMYALRDVTATVDSIPLIAASIMSKKLAVNNQGLVLDVKVGSGAFMKNLDDARALAVQMVRIGQQAGRKVRAVLSNMDEPLGEMVGNALEVKEAIDTLRNGGPASFTNLVTALAAQALVLADESLSPQQAEANVREALSSGKALQTFRDMVEAQGGDPHLVDQPERLPAAGRIEPLTATTAGYIRHIQCEQIGIGAMMLGAGRETKDSVIDMAVGLKIVKHVGDRVEVGEPLAELHLNPDRDNARAIDTLLSAFSIGAEPVPPQPLIHDIVS